MGKVAIDRSWDCNPRCRAARNSRFVRSTVLPLGSKGLDTYPKQATHNIIDPSEQLAAESGRPFDHYHAGTMGHAIQ